MSGQWNKPFSTGLGGILLVNDAELADRVAAIIDREAFTPGRLKTRFSPAQILAHKLLVRPATAIAVMFLYRALNRLGLAIGSSSQEELRGKCPSVIDEMAPCQVRRGLREMAAIEDNIQHRIARRRSISANCRGSASRRWQARPAADCRCCVSRAGCQQEEVLARAGKARVEIGSWFEVPLHPEGTRMETFGYREGMCPAAEAASREVINLPTHRKASRAVADEPRFPAKTGDAAIMLKRLLDILISAFGLLLLSPSGRGHRGRGEMHFRRGRSFSPRASGKRLSSLRGPQIPHDGAGRRERGGPITCGGDPRSPGSADSCERRNSTKCRNWSTCSAAT